MEISAQTEDLNKRVDAFLAEKADLSRSFVQKLLEEEAVFSEGKPVRKNDRVRGGEVFSLEIPEPEMLDVLPENLPLEILYEDEDLLVINKEKGMVVHPAAGHFTGTLVNALLYHLGDRLSGINGELRPGIVHRIDKDTSGLLVVAKNDFAHQALSDQLKDHTLARTYEAIVCGRMKEDEGTVSRPIGRHKTDRKKMAVAPMATETREAVTHYRVLGAYPGFTHLELRLETGRTHQIRVHMASLGHPVAGDEIYGDRQNVLGLRGQCLHAKKLRLIHPRSGEVLEVESPLPDYFAETLKRLEKRT